MMITIFLDNSFLFQGAMEGKFRDASAFSGDPVVEVKEALSATGYHFEGKDILYSGITGEPLEVYIFKGPIYYQKLKHMVVDKVYKSVATFVCREDVTLY